MGPPRLVGRQGLRSNLIRGRGGMRVTVNRAPLMTLWAAVVAERLGVARGLTERTA